MGKTDKKRALPTILAAGLLLLGLVWLFTNKETKGFLESKGLHFTQAKDLISSFTSKEQSSKAVKKIIKKDTALTKQLTKAELLKIDTLKSKIEFLTIDNAEGKNALLTFFQALDKASDSLFHVWYYGDSQIEGDRITQDLRLLLQKRFGGSGQGLITLNDVASYRYIETKTKGLAKYNVFINRKTSGFGFNGVKYKAAVTDTVQTGSYATLKIFPGLSFQRAYLFYGNSKAGKITTTIDKNKTQTIDIPENQAMGKVLLSNAPFKEITVQFNLPGTDLYGYVLEGNKGIYLDNCGIRGHSGDGLFNIQNAAIQQQASAFNTKLIVFQYGNNAIPYIKGEQHAAQVGNEFYKLFVKFKKALPNVSILVVSGGDMGRIIDEKAVSYPQAATLALELEKAAAKAGCAYFDLYALMQREGGIAGWVKKGRASLDGHLSAYGQQFFANALYNELLKEYEIYRISKNKQHQ